MRQSLAPLEFEKKKKRFFPFEILNKNDRHFFFLFFYRGTHERAAPGATCPIAIFQKAIHYYYLPVEK